uniref:Integrase catalytic domain-containing protein n=1 Tax=Amphimedon queenslandica TaxID=400682 RepID=A0A1X7T4R5_AMPQE
MHPIAFASRSLSAGEKNYSITDLETLAVVWAVQHFRAYLYGHTVTVIMDNSAVKSRPFQIFGVDILELPVTQRGNRYVIVFQDFLTKWPMVFPAPDQKANRIARLVAEEILPLFGVPECLLSDRGTNLLANVMKELCTFLGIQKLITTAYHPQCNGMIERLNSTLKSMLRRHAAKFGPQWDQYLPGVLWAYQNTPHEASKEKPSFLMFGVDLRSPTEAALLPPEPVQGCDLIDYWEELILSLSSARELAASSIHKEQQRGRAI